MKSLKRIIPLLLLALLLGACHKTCLCKGYDGGEYEFSAEEIDDLGRSCTNMRDYPVPSYYSVCSWE